MAEDDVDLTKKYTARVVEKIPTKPGCWEYLRVVVERDGEAIGEYVRDYPSLMSTFYPFAYRGKEYALYSPSYTATRVMTLPDCKDYCGEEKCAYGFCPTGFYVPEVCYQDRDDVNDPCPDPRDRVAYDAWYARHPFVTRQAEFGFVSGCVWGDDGSWKVQYLDLSRLGEGVIVRDDRFGYIELVGGSHTLRDAIDCENWEPDHPYIRIACASRFDTTRRVGEKLS